MIKDVNTTMVVGSCWEGRDSRMNFHFKGFLAGLSVLRGRNENPRVLSCLHRCQEGLQLPPTDTLDPGTDVSIDADATSVSIEGKDAIDVEDMVSQISYLNSREFPTPGRRSLRVASSVKCNDGKSIKIDNSYSYVIVLPPEQPSITLNGTPNIAREYESFVQGIELFSDITVNVNHEAEEDPVAENDVDDNDISDSEDEGSKTNAAVKSATTTTTTNSHKLDACSVQVYPPLNPDYEYFRMPLNFMQHLGVHSKQSKDGVVIMGKPFSFSLPFNYSLVRTLRHYFCNHL
jgi:hypothetical protein